MVLGVSMWLLHEWLLRRFRERFPDVAQRVIPDAFGSSRRPGKQFFFLRKEVVEHLRNDSRLRRARLLLVALTVATFTFPFLGAAILVWCCD